MAEVKPEFEKQSAKKHITSVEEVNASGIIEPVVEKETVTLPKPKPAGSGKRSLLDSLRHQHITQKTNEDKKEAIPVTNENLHEQWKCFTEKLKNQLKHSVVTVFNNAKLEVVNEQHFSVAVSASLEQKFIEAEKTQLLEYLKDCFQNRNIGFTIKVVENDKEIVVAEVNLSSREKYLKLSEQNPMIKELKDRLKLELD